MRTPIIVLLASLIGIAQPAMAQSKDNQRPATVGNVKAENVSDSAIRISWSQPWDDVGVDGYNIYRDGAYYLTIGNTTSYTDHSLAANQTYRYSVVAFDAARNYSTLSAAATATTNGRNDVSGGSTPGNTPVSNGNPVAPENLQAQVLNNSSARLSWSSSSGGADGYNIYRNGGYIATVRDSNNYTARSLNSGSTYTFDVVAFRNNRFSVHSNSIQVNTSGDTTAEENAPSPSLPAQQPVGNGDPVPPVDLQADIANSSTAIISWRPSTGAAEGYNIYRDGRYIATVKGSYNYTARSLNTNQTYTFDVVAFRNGRYSAHSEGIQVQTSGSTDVAENTPVAERPAAPPPPQNSSSAVPDGYSLVFSDEFNQGSLNSGKWNTRYRWGADWIINGESQYYVDAQKDRDFGATPFRTDGNNLTIRATRTPDWLRGKARNQPYLSGAMTTHGKFTMKYGYVEMRAKLPRGKGLWPAFWLLHERDDLSRPEIDVVEMLGDNTGLVYQTYHFFENNGRLRSTPSFQATGSDYASDFHTYGMLWEPGRITWYVDGVATNRYSSSNVSDEYMYILLNLALGGGWAGLPDASTPFPADFVIDYVRAYQK